MCNNIALLLCYCQEEHMCHKLLLHLIIAHWFCNAAPLAAEIVTSIVSKQQQQEEEEEAEEEEHQLLNY